MTYEFLNGREIRIKTTKTGRRIAHYYSWGRWLPVPIAIADMFIAEGKATQI